MKNIIKILYFFIYGAIILITKKHFADSEIIYKTKILIVKSLHNFI